MTPEQRSREFCKSAFGPLGVDIEPYVKIIAELIEGAEREQLRSLRPLMDNLREYISRSIVATQQCCEELPGYKSEISDQHLATLELMLDGINRTIAAN